MPIDFAQMEFVQRSKGHSAVAGSAYQCGAKFYEHRTGQSHDYSNRKDILYSEVMLPDGASEHLANPEVLWNEAENFEVRKNAQTARHLVLALPADSQMSLEDNVELTRRFVYHHFVSHGLGAQVSVHAPHKCSQNVHAHIMLTTRRIQGPTFDKYKARDLLPEVRGGRVIKEDKIWKDYWREAQNEFFLEKGVDLEVDPTGIYHGVHLGKDAFHGGADNEKVKENKFREQAAKEILIHNPEVLIEHLTLRDAVFSELDICKLVNRHTASRGDYKRALSEVLRSKQLVLLGENDFGRKLYTTQSMIQIERALEEGALKLCKNNRHQVHQKIVQAQTKSANLSGEQAQALSHITKASGLSVLAGAPGSGKTFVLGEANVIWEERFNVIGVSLYNKAAQNLENETSIKSQSLHSLLWQVRHQKKTLTSKDVVVLDEAGLVDAPLMAELVQVCLKAKAKLVLAGDPNQLQPIGPGAPLRAIVERVGFAQLKTIKRQTKDWQNQCSLWLAKGKTHKALKRYAGRGCVHFDGKENDPFAKMANRYCALTSANKKTLVLASTNQEVAELNTSIRAQLKQNGFLSKTTKFESSEGQMEVAIGEKIVFLANDKRLGVSNSQTAEVVGTDYGQLQVKFDDNPSKIISIKSEKYNKIDYGYALTVAKSQGQSVDSTLAYVGPYLWDRHNAYVGLTRHKESLDIYAATKHHRNLKDLSKSFRRQKIKDSVLDYPFAFGQRRNLLSLEKIREIKDKALEKVKQKADLAKAYIKDKTKQLQEHISQSVESTSKLHAVKEPIQKSKPCQTSQLKPTIESLLKDSSLIEGTKVQAYLENLGVKEREQKSYMSLEKDGKSYLVAPKILMDEVKSVSVFEIKQKDKQLKATFAVQSNNDGMAQVKQGRGIGENYIFDNLEEALRQSKSLKQANIFVMTNQENIKATLNKMTKTREVMVISDNKGCLKKLKEIQTKKLKLCSQESYALKKEQIQESKEIDREI